MKGVYIPFNDGWGIVGYGYECPECEHLTQFTSCEEGCEKCGYSEEYVDPNEWHDKYAKMFERKL